MPGTTILDLPYAYRLDYQPYRTRSQKAQTWIWLKDTQPVAIPSYASQEALVAIEITYRGVRPGAAGEATETVRLFRMIGGVLFEPMTTASKYPLKGYDGPGAHLTFQRQFRDKPPARILASDRDERRAAAAGALAERMAIVDGETWVAVEVEPHFVLRRSGVDNGWLVTLSTTPWRSHGEATFRLDRINDAVGYAGALGRLNADFHARLPDVMIYDDAALKRDEIVEIARGVLHDLKGREAQFGPPSHRTEHHAALLEMAPVADSLTRDEAAVVIQSALALADDHLLGGVLKSAEHRWRNAEKDLHEELALLRDRRDADLDAIRL